MALNILLKWQWYLSAEETSAEEMTRYCIDGSHPESSSNHLSSLYDLMEGKQS